MTLRRTLLSAGALALWALAVWLPINVIWQGDIPKAIYGTTFGVVGVFYGVVAGRYWLGVHRPEGPHVPG